jgi:hypothetical protein
VQPEGHRVGSGPSRLDTVVYNDARPAADTAQAPAIRVPTPVSLSDANFGLRTLANVAMAAHYPPILQPDVTAPLQAAVTMGPIATPQCEFVGWQPQPCTTDTQYAAGVAPEAAGAAVQQSEFVDWQPSNLPPGGCNMPGCASEYRPAYQGSRPYTIIAGTQQREIIGSRSPHVRQPSPPIPPAETSGSRRKDHTSTSSADRAAIDARRRNITYTSSPNSSKSATQTTNSQSAASDSSEDQNNAGNTTIAEGTMASQDGSVICNDKETAPSDVGQQCDPMALAAQLSTIQPSMPEQPVHTYTDQVIDPILFNEQADGMDVEMPETTQWSSDTDLATATTPYPLPYSYAFDGRVDATSQQVGDWPAGSGEMIINGEVWLAGVYSAISGSTFQGQILQVNDYNPMNQHDSPASTGGSGGSSPYGATPAHRNQGLETSEVADESQLYCSHEEFQAYTEWLNSF